MESHIISQEDKFDVDFVKTLLIVRFDEIDFNDAKKDVLPFIKDTSVLDIWSKEFFIAITSQLTNKEYLNLDRDKSTFKSHRDFCF